MKLDFYYVKPEYINFLKDKEREARGFTCVPNVEYASGNTKFVYGTVLKINDIDYYVPVSSKLHYKQDDMLIKGKDKQNTAIATLRFQYMVPVPSQCLELVVRDQLPTPEKREKVRKELAFCRKNRDKIFERAEKSYNRIVNKVNKDLVANSCDYKILEAAYLEYIKQFERDSVQQSSLMDKSEDKSKPQFTLQGMQHDKKEMIANVT